MEQAIKERSANLEIEYLITFYNLCKISSILRKFTPSASLGMFSLSVKDVKYFYEEHFFYLFYESGKNVVANYDHTEKYFFDIPEQAIKFLEEKAVVFLKI